jgi:hypothetical protein
MKVPSTTFGAILRASLPGPTHWLSLMMRMCWHGRGEFNPHPRASLEWRRTGTAPAVQANPYTTSRCLAVVRSRVVRNRRPPQREPHPPA